MEKLYVVVVSSVQTLRERKSERVNWGLTGDLSIRLVLKRYDLELVIAILVMFCSKLID